MDQPSLGLTRRYTEAGVDPYESVAWELRQSRLINHKTGNVVFEQTGIEFPVNWSQNATNIVAQKYFRGSLGTPEREFSLRQLIGRVVNTITAWGERDGYFAGDEERDCFHDELTYILLHQMAAFNSPVWFNIGVPNTPQQASACFILSVDDSMASIKDWWANEAAIFQGGSGAGANLSRLRGSMEPIGGSANTSSGPLAFMQAADSSANAIKSGGKTRRAAKMVILDVDHPDVLDFIACKQEAEDMARVLKQAESLGFKFDMGFDGKHASWLPYQNANNSVRVSDEFMHAYEEDGSWQLRARVSGEVVAEVPARQLMRRIAEAAWACADPGMQYDSIINDWHTTPSAGRINGSNPCSEYMHLDNSSCNLASLNLMKFLGDDGAFRIDDFRHVTEVIFIAQDILVGNADYPTESIAQVSRAYRQLGIGYANLGALLMAVGLPYDSEEGRSLAAAITATLTGQSYLTSTRMAARLGSFTGFEADRQATIKVLTQHRTKADEISPSPLANELIMMAREIWSQVVDAATESGVRNSQASVLAPTGTIGFMMDCDTTGIEPDFALVKDKQLVGGGSMSIVNQTVPRALLTLGYSPHAVEAIVAHLEQTKSIVGAPGLKPEHVEVFATAVGENFIHYQGHVHMMAAVQPFLSGAISKTVNMPETVTVEEVEQLYVEAWRLGLKAIAIYRDNCKVAQPLASSASKEGEQTTELATKHELPRSRQARNYEFRVADVKGFVNVGLFENGQPAEIFFNITKQGSTLSGIMDNFGIAISLGLQKGVPLEAYVRKYVGTQFEPRGMTDDPDVRIANSLLDYIFRRLALDFLSVETRERLHIFSTDERVAQQVAEPVMTPTAATPAPVQVVMNDPNAPMCGSCGTHMQRAGSCFVCATCGTTSGCS